MRRVVYFLLWLAGAITIFSSAYAASSNITRVWANCGGDKVTRDELRASNDAASVFSRVWNGQQVTIFGARNEMVAFTLVLEAPTTQASNVTISLETLSGPSGTRISSHQTTGNGVFNWVGRNIELFYLRYLQIKGISTDLFYDNYDERHIPKRFQRPWSGDGEGSGRWQDRPDHDKFYPDIAVPLELVSGFNIAKGTNQSIWVDIFIPKNVPAGMYQGTLAVKEGGITTHGIPIKLTVLPFTLPDIPSAKTMLIYSPENINDRYFGQAYISPDDSLYASSLALEDQHFQIAHRHKLSLVGNPEGYTPVSRMGDAWANRLNGNLFKKTAGYDGPGIGVGNNVYVIGEYGQWPWQDGSQAEMWSNSDAWVQYFDAASFATATEYFLYLIDESDNYPLIEKWSTWIHNNPGPGKRLMSMATIDLPKAEANTPSLDIPTSWASIGITQEWQSSADAYLKKTDKRFYLYNGIRPACGSFATEDDGVSPRVLAWAQYKKKIDRWFYWESTYYDNYQGGEGLTNVFNRAQTYGSYDSNDVVLGQTGWNYLNGDGVLFYPGTDRRFPGSSYGVMGPFASIRLKLWRRGIQDVDYLTMAAQKNPTQTARIVNKMLPKTLWEYGVSDPSDPTWLLSDISWSIDPDDWEQARADLAQIIVNGKPPILNGKTPVGMFILLLGDQ